MRLEQRPKGIRLENFAWTLQVSLAIKLLCYLTDGGKFCPEIGMYKCWMVVLVCKIQIQFWTVKGHGQVIAK